MVPAAAMLRLGLISSIRAEFLLCLPRGSQELSAAAPPLHPVQVESPAGDGAGARWAGGWGWLLANNTFHSDSLSLTRRSVPIQHISANQPTVNSYRPEPTVRSVTPA